MTPTQEAALREKLAAIEHERWSDWQRYMHSKMLTNDNEDKYYHLKNMWFKRWQRQIETPYANLTDQEQASDMEQVDRYWPLIQEYIKTQTAEAYKAGRLDELHLLHETPSSRWVTNPGGMAGISFNVIDEHIAELKGNQGITPDYLRDFGNKGKE